MLPRQPQQRLADRLAAHLIALGQLLFPHIIAGRQAAGQDISAQALIDVVAQKHRIYLRRAL
jgi:iron-sulfur cluster repair protein YtfE (RIC family)